MNNHNDRFVLVLLSLGFINIFHLTTGREDWEWAPIARIADKDNTTSVTDITQRSPDDTTSNDNDYVSSVTSVDTAIDGDSNATNIYLTSCADLINSVTSALRNTTDIVLSDKPTGNKYGL